MITPEVMAYVKEQLKNGYTKDEIKAALHSQGWTDEEIEDAFPHELPQLPKDEPPQPAPQTVSPPVVIKGERTAGFAIALIGGFFILISGIEGVLGIPIIAGQLNNVGLSVTLFGYLEPMLAGMTGQALLGAGLLIVISALLMGRQIAKRVFAIIALVLSVLVLIGFNGFLVFLGAALGAIGGLMEARYS